MIDTILTNFFGVFPDGLFLGVLSLFAVWFVFITILDIIDL